MYMSEQPHERGEVQRVNGAVHRLRSDFVTIGHSYVDTFFAVQKFVESDYAIDERWSAVYITQLEEQRVLPRKDMYHLEPERALDMHRLAMYSLWIPLYREMHSSREFNDWLPSALDIALPQDGTHASENCDTQGAVAEEVSIGDISCSVADRCPRKYIMNDLLINTPYLPLDPLEQGGTDLIKARTDARILLQRAHDKKIITQSQLLQALTDYRQAYDNVIG